MVGSLLVILGFAYGLCLTCTQVGPNTDRLHAKLRMMHGPKSSHLTQGHKPLHVKQG